MASYYTWGSVTTYMILEVCSERPLDTLCLGCHNYMVTALGPCVKWPLLNLLRPLFHMWLLTSWSGGQLALPCMKRRLLWQKTAVPMESINLA